MTSDPVLEAFSAQVRARPGRPLLVSGRRVATVGEVDALAAVVAARLRAAGVEPGSLVTLAVANGPAFLAALLGVRRAGAAAVLVDVRTPAEEQRRVSDALGASLALSFRDPWPGGGEDVVVDRLRPPTAANVGPEVAVLKLTSGSTGLPRGILAPAAALVADDAQLASTMGMVAAERILAAIPMSHSYGLSSVAMPALVRGSLLVVADGDGPFAGVQAALDGGVTFLPTVPAYLQALLRMAEPPPLPPSLRMLLTAGAPLPAEVAARFRSTYGHAVHCFYGASECGGICFDREGTAGERGTLGEPVDGVRVTLEADDGTAAAEGAVTVRSAAVAEGYHPEPDPRLGGGRFRTGDLAAWRERELVMLGRSDDVVNVRGRKVSPGEVEAVIRGLDGVDEVAVVGAPAPEGVGEVVGAVVVARGGSLEAEAVLAWCRQRLAPHKVPRSVALVGELPRTARGKVDRQALRALVAGRG